MAPQQHVQIVHCAQLSKILVKVNYAFVEVCKKCTRVFFEDVEDSTRCFKKSTSILGVHFFVKTMHCQVNDALSKSMEALSHSRIFDRPLNYLTYPIHTVRC